MGGGYVHEWCKPMMKAMRSNSTIQPNKPEPIASIASSPKAPPEDETRPKEVKEKRMCVHGEEPVLATHRRSKVKGGGYVHEWCKPMMKAVRSLSTLQSMKPALAGTDNGLEKTPPKEDYASTRMCVQCE